jgi:hypothetical protein
MTPELHNVLEQVKKLPIEQKRELADLILRDIEQPQNESAEVRAALAVVEETFGSIKGVDRETLIRLAEDEEFCGY